MADFPFDCIVVTCPDSNSAETARKGPLLELERSLNGLSRTDHDVATRKRPITIVATSDPFGSRCGSGGGTLAAMEALELKLLENHHGPDPDCDPLASRITLILHAGGESSRCPSQMIHGTSVYKPMTFFFYTNIIVGVFSLNFEGKAWASLPILRDQQTQQLKGAPSYASILNSSITTNNPTVLLIDQLTHFFHKLQHTGFHISRPGTVIVAATDTILQLFERDSENELNRFGDRETETQLDPQDPDESVAVIGVAVPAELAISKNHGVYDLGLEQGELGLQNDSQHMESKDIPSQKAKPLKKSYMLLAPRRVLQKPSLEVLRADKSIHFEADKVHQCNDGDGGSLCRNPEDKGNSDHMYNAWIDTGIVIFLPKARSALRQLSFGLLNKCTSRGLTQAYHDSLKQIAAHQKRDHDTHPAKRVKMNPSNGNDKDDSTLSDYEKLKMYARDAALKVDLYTDLLHSFSFRSSVPDEPPTHSDLNMAPLQRQLRSSLCHLRLKVLALPRGKFLHLGTTQEWVNFLVDNAASHARLLSGGNASKVDRRLKLPCLARHSCWLGPSNGYSVAAESVILNSALEPTKALSIGKGTVVEHCMFPSSSSPPSIEVGSNCLLSGWRPARNVVDHYFLPPHSSKQRRTPYRKSTCASTVLATSPPGVLIVPDNMCIQMMALKQTGKLVYMVVGMRDDIKKTPPQCLYNIPLEQVLGVLLDGHGSEKRPQCSHNESDYDILWPSSTADRSIWRAKIHPIVEEGTPFDSVFLWLLQKLQPQYHKFDKIEVAKSLELWHFLPRDSLEELHGLADASRDWEFRRELMGYTTSTRRRIFHHDWKAYWGIEKDSMTSSEVSDDTSALAPNDERDSTAHFGSCTMDWTWLLDLGRCNIREALVELSELLQTLHRVTLKSFASLPNYPLCGRALMVASALTAEVANSWWVQTSKPSSDLVSLETFKRELNAKIKSIVSLDKVESDVDQREMELMRRILSTIENGIQYDKQFGASNCAATFVSCSKTYEELAHFVTERCVVGEKLRQLWDKIDRASAMATNTTRDPVFNRWVISTAPARIDLAGGWSDTPPICFSEFGGAVTGLAVQVDGNMAVSCRCRIVPGRQGILLRSELRRDCSIAKGDFPALCTLLSCQQIIVEDGAVLADFRDTLSDCALLKCALICLGLALPETSQHQRKSKLQAHINRFCGASQDGDFRLEIVSTSLLPQGSGMGTSSILAGCVLAAVGKAIGRTDMDDPENLMYAVLMLEQLLTAGGGYQDQVNGLIGGLKTVSSKPRRLPLEISVQRVDIPVAVATELNERLVLAFTGKTRLAKNILQNVLRRWARRTPDIVQTVKDLLRCAQNAREAVLSGKLDDLGECLNSYWRHKKIMAGDDSGVEPVAVHGIISALLERKAIIGGSLCGAGGGGFLVILASPGMNKSKIKQLVQDELIPHEKEFAQFTWHDCTICEEGLTTRVLEGEIPVHSFDVAWHANANNETL